MSSHLIDTDWLSAIVPTPNIIQILVVRHYDVGKKHDVVARTNGFDFLDHFFADKANFDKFLKKLIINRAHFFSLIIPFFQSSNIEDFDGTF